MGVLYLRFSIIIEPIKMIFKVLKKMKSSIFTLNLGSFINGFQTLIYDVIDV